MSSGFCHCTNGFGHTRGIEGCVHWVPVDDVGAYRIDPDPIRPTDDTVALEDDVNDGEEGS